MGIKVYASNEKTVGSYKQKVNELKSRAVSTRIKPSGSDGRVYTEYLDKDGKVIGRTYEFPKSTVGKNEQGWVSSNGKDYYSSDLETISGEKEKDYTVNDLKSINYNFLPDAERIKILESVLKNAKGKQIKPFGDYYLNDREIRQYERELKELKQKTIGTNSPMSITA